MQLVAEPQIPLALWLTLFGLAVAVWIWYAVTTKIALAPRRRGWVLGLMAACLVLPLIVLLNLTWIERIAPPAGKPVVHMMIDASASMLTDDGGNETRLERAYSMAENVASALPDSFEVRTSVFDKTVRSAAGKVGSENESTKTAAMETNLVAALEAVVREDVPQGQSILLLSDGIHNASETAEVLQAANQANAMDVPVFTSTVGGKVGVKNVAVAFQSPQELAFVDQSIPVTVLVKSQGLPARRVELVLSKQGVEVDRQKLSLPPDQTVQATFLISEHETGLVPYEATVKLVTDEATEDDNRALMLAKVVDEPVQMMLIEGKPYWDTKFLIRRLSADPSLDLTSVIRMGTDRFMKRRLKRTMNFITDDDTNGTPSSNIGGIEESTIINDATDVLSAEALSRIQILVLGRNAECFLTDEVLENVRHWIARNGGALVCARGAPSTLVGQRLQQILPVRYSAGRESRFRVSMTSQGEQLRWLGAFDNALGSMPSLSTVSVINQRQGLSNVLAKAIGSDQTDSIPVISYQPYGLGRTVVVEGAGMWRWALMAPQYKQQQEIYGALWRSLLRWLVSRTGLLPGQDVAIQSDRVGFTTGDVATATMLVRQNLGLAPPKVRLTHPDGETSDHVPAASGRDPGVFRLDFGKLTPGQYALETVSNHSPQSPEVQTAAFSVRSGWVESLELDARSDLMQKISTLSGGVELDSSTPAELGKRFKDHLERARPPQFRRVPMWDRWWVMLSVIGLWAATWTIRRQSGLV